MHTATGILLALVLMLAAVACGGDDDTTRSERPNIEDELTPVDVDDETDDGATTDDGTTGAEPTPTAVVTEIEPERLTYTVQQGDLLGGIAQTFGVPLGALIEVNNLDNPDLIQIGQEILIPTDEEVAAWEAAQSSDGDADGGEADTEGSADS